MNTKRVSCLLAAGALCALVVAGCATRGELIARRIGEKAAFFASLPPEKQNQLRAGKVVPGDTRDAVWIAYGNPDRMFQRVSGTGTNEVWSYLSDDVSYIDSPQPVYHPVRLSRGRTLWCYDTVWATDVYHHPYEYLRIEFHEGKIIALETPVP